MLIAHRFTAWVRSLTLLCILINAFPALAWQSACTSFNLTDIAGVSLVGTTYYAANTTVNITNEFSSIDVDNLPGFCRVEVRITTNATGNSSCNTEVWLPDEWNGRYLTIGNGGFAGGASVADLGTIAIAQGFAGMSTDTGHTGSAIDGSWAGPHNDNAIVDFGWRALHLSVGTGKEIVQQYYGEAQTYSYYMGCSTGGRQGLKEVQMFPDDFDGAIVGSPANWLTHLFDWSIKMALDVQPTNSSRFIDTSLWIDVIHPEVLRQCDALDGLVDGIINDPRYCLFRPETLTCHPGQNTSTCLTIPQVEALLKIYAAYYETNQTWIFGGYYPGGEVAFAESGLVTAVPFQLNVEWFLYFIANDTEWTIYDYNVSVVELSDQINPGQANAINPNLTAFAGSGRNGKVIQYVGWADQLISPGNSLHYYETVHAFTQAYTETDINDYYRLFTVPGMNHCGYGANAFGGVLQASSGMPPLSNDPEYNILSALVQWVEEDVAPESLSAVYYNDNNVENGIGFIRPLCQYPLSLQYIGGNSTTPEAFACV
ncbi:feruloyl esterase-like protein [Laetiporus sulphureus 93-53]|uniref:Carboxylic ester hydrolase n=1 Tax=Laetiporus sulphureus 93-53 TaxID=1314785 RepID=A0A165HEF3_9APHY|nr:feruloyl esterase-like protein [Laetiporus sulphureus 93-53]KZT11629.1 feruloyl esterase-like protein [Laetiporus sulphureus 93-53]